MVAVERNLLDEAELEVVGEALRVRDLGSTNGTYIGAERIGEHVRVEPGTRIRIGRTVLELRK